jgi:hypothetical protein
MNKRDDLPAHSDQVVRDDAQAVVFVLEILCIVVLRFSTLNRQHSARRSDLASQLGEAAQRVRVLGLAASPSAELADSIRDGIKLAKTALIELEPRVEGSPTSLFFYHLRSLIANSISFILRRPTADPLSAVRSAIKKLDCMLQQVDAPQRRAAGEKPASFSEREPSPATDQSRQLELEPEQPAQSRIAPNF